MQNIEIILKVDQTIFKIIYNTKLSQKKVFFIFNYFKSNNLLKYILFTEVIKALKGLSAVW